MSPPVRSVPAPRYLRKSPRFSVGSAATVTCGGTRFDLGDISGAGMRIAVPADHALAKGDRPVFDLEIRHPRDENDRERWSIPALCAWRTETEAGFSFEIADETKRGIERMLARIFATGAVKVVNTSE